AANSPEISSPAVELNRYDTIFTRTGSANAFSRKATCNASPSLIGPEATGAQHTGAVVSTTGNALGMTPSLPDTLTYIKKVGHAEGTTSSIYVSQLGGSLPCLVFSSPSTSTISTPQSASTPSCFRPNRPNASLVTPTSRSPIHR